MSVNDSVRLSLQLVEEKIDNLQALQENDQFEEMFTKITAEIYRWSAIREELLMILSEMHMQSLS